MHRGTNSFHEPLHADLAPDVTCVDRLVSANVPQLTGLWPRSAPHPGREFEVQATADEGRCSVVPAVSGLPVVSGRGHSLSPSWAADDVLVQDVPGRRVGALGGPSHRPTVPQLLSGQTSTGSQRGRDLAGQAGRYRLVMLSATVCAVAAGARSFVAVAKWGSLKPIVAPSRACSGSDGAVVRGIGTEPGRFGHRHVRAPLAGGDQPRMLALSTTSAVRGGVAS